MAEGNDAVELEAKAPNRWLVALLGFYGLALGALVHLDPPLGHDEAIYATGGRSLLGDGPSAAFNLYRPVGMKLVAAPGVFLGGSDAAMRAVPILLTLAFLACSWGAALALSGRVAAHVLAAASLSWSHLMWRGLQLLSDVPSALACLGFVWFLLRILSPAGGGKSPAGGGSLRHAAAAAACGGAAFWLRYGALVALVCVVAAFVALWPSRVWARRGPMMLFALLLAALLLPFFVYSTRMTGSWDGILELAAATADRRFFGDGLLTYARGWFGEAAGPIMGGLAIIGLAAGARDLLRGRRSSWRAVMALAGAGQIVWLGLTIHAEPRYIFFPVLLLAVAGADAVAAWLAGARVHARRFATAGGLGISLVAAAVVFGLTVRTMARMEEHDGVIQSQARAVRRDAEDERCLVFTNREPQVSWYSGCEARRIPAAIGAEAVGAMPRVYLLAFDRRGHHAATLARRMVRGPAIDVDQIGDASSGSYLVRLRRR